MTVDQLLAELEAMLAARRERNMYTHNMMPRDRYNAKRKAQYEKRKAKHLPRLREIANDMTIAQMVEDTGTTRSFVERVIREEGLRQRGRP